jgi:hypothetical protein
MVNEVDSSGIPPSAGLGTARLKAGFLKQDCKAWLNLVLAYKFPVLMMLLASSGRSSDHVPQMGAGQSDIA